MPFNLGSVGPGSAGEAQRTIDPNAFGAGIGQAISGLGQSVDNYSQSVDAVKASTQGLANTYLARQEKLDRSKADIGLIQTQTNLEQSLIESQSKYPLGADGYTNDAKVATDKAFSTFLQTVPDNLKSEFGPRIASIQQGMLNNAFKFQLTAQDNAFKLTTTDLAKHAIDSISSGNGTIETWTPQIDAMFKNSTLPAAETEQLKNSILHDVQAVDAQRVAKDIALSPAHGVGTTGGPTNGSDIVAAGVPGEMRALLNFISKDESGGAYDIRNGGGKFTDFSDHPGRDPQQASSAAGRYQIVIGTWKRAQAALGLPDFSPESQDRAAIWIAQQDYSARTGRNLMADLQSGDHKLIDGVRQTLAGKGNVGTTWPSLQGYSAQGRSADDFYSAITGGKGTMSAVLTSPIYDKLSFAERQQIVSGADQAASQQAAQQQTAATAQINSRITTLQDLAVRGDPSFGQALQSSYDKGLMPPDKFVSLQAFGAAQAQSHANANIFQNVMSGATQFSANNPHMVSSNDALYTRDWSAPIAGGDKDYFNNTILPFIAKTNYVPKEMQTQLAAMAGSSNQQSASFALQAALALKDHSPLAFSMLPKSVQDSAIYYGYNKGNGNVMQDIQNHNDPAYKAAQVINKQAAATYAVSKNTSGLFTLESIAKTILPQSSIPFTSNTGSNLSEVGPQMQAEFMTEYSYLAPKYSDPSQAYAAATDHMKLTWGTTNIGGNNILMRHPPEKAYPNMDPAQMQEQLKSDLPSGPDEKLRLISDNRTEQDLASGKPASYSVLKTDAQGIIMPVLTDPGGSPRPALARIYFDPNYKNPVDLNKALDNSQTMRERGNDYNSPGAFSYNAPTEAGGLVTPVDPINMNLAIPSGLDGGERDKFKTLSGQYALSYQLWKDQPQDSILRDRVNELGKRLNEMEPN